MLLEVIGLSKKYKRGGAEFFAVDNVDFRVAPGEMAFITGRSGSGKSTLLNMITGLLAPTSGSVAFEGRRLSGMKDRELSHYRNRRIGYIPQGHSILPNFTLLDNVLLPHFIYDKRNAPYDRADALLAQMGIRHLAGAFPAELSGGELRRACIARGLINSPRLLVADEPTGDLDPDAAADVAALFKDIAAGGTAILAVTHAADIIPPGSARYQMASGRFTAPE
jgi:putative ABC transport system ATP-binding protein